MGVNIAELFPKQEISLDDLKGKIVAIDFMNVAYQFLASIRQRDGSLLTDSSGNITSHLQGLFNRSVSLLEKGIKLVYVFDGGAPSLKAKERELRMERKKKAQEKYDLAVFEEDVDSITVGTDIKGYVSRDGGTTFTEVTLVDEGDYESGKQMLAGTVSVAGQPSGSSIKYKITAYES